MPIIDQLTIERFRGIRDLTMSGFGRVNVLVGENDSGKTSVLEALRLLASPHDVAMWIACGERGGRWTMRGLPNLIDLVFPAARPGGDATSQVIVRAEGKSFRQALVADALPPRMVAEQGSAGGSEPYEVREFKVQLEVPVAPNAKPASSNVENPRVEHSADHKTYTFAFARRGQSSWSGVTPVIPIAFERAYDFESDSWRFTHLSRLMKAANLRVDFDRAVRTIDPKIARLLPLERDGDLEVLVEDSDGVLLPITAYGHGVRQALRLMMFIAAVPQGLALVDEFDAGIHTRAMSPLFRVAVDWARRNDTTLFLTTHNLDAVDALLAAADSPEEDVVVFKLGRVDGRTEARRFGEDMLRRVRYERGLDIR